SPPAGLSHQEMGFGVQRPDFQTFLQMLAGAAEIALGNRLVGLLPMLGNARFGALGPPSQRIEEIAADAEQDQANDREDKPPARKCSASKSRSCGSRRRRRNHGCFRHGQASLFSQAFTL